MAISFGGLATGLDTAKIIEGLMQAERAPIARVEADKTWLNNRLTAFTQFDTALNSFLDGVESLTDRDQYYKKTATLGSKEFFSATIAQDALNASYNVEVKSLALIQKSHTVNGFSSSSDQIFTAGNISFTVGTETHTVAIPTGEASLNGVMKAINDADIGITASIINDGSATTPFKLTLTGQTVATNFSMDATGINGTESIGTLTHYQNASAASIVVDGIPISSNSNTIEDAIPGVTLDLLKSEVGTLTTIDIKSDNSAVANNIKTFVNGFNQVVSFVSSQSKIGDTKGGVLGGDSGLNSIKRHLQNMLTSLSDNAGSFKALAQLGLETQKDGTLVLDSKTLDKAISTDLDSVISLLAGDANGNQGIASEFETYLKGLTDSTRGVLAGRKQSINNNIKRLDKNITMMTARLEKREELFKSQFNAMETLISSLNATGSYLSQQLDAINLGGNN